MQYAYYSAMRSHILASSCPYEVKWCNSGIINSRIHELKTGSGRISRNVTFLGDPIQTHGNIEF